MAERPGDQRAQSSTPYVGNGHYCYANVTAMLLASHGEHIEPRLIEVCSGVGIGAHWSSHADLIFFDAVPPDVGITMALQGLGFEVEEHAFADGNDPPWSLLETRLAAGPAILGPVDMGLLMYRPGRRGPSGNDHFILAHGIDESEVYLHDPAGYPYVSMTRTALAEAWRADKITYRRGAYRWWAAPHRVASPTDEQLLTDVRTTLAHHYRHQARSHPGAAGHGGAAIRQLAIRVSEEDLSPQLTGHLTTFALQLAARRACDFATFFNSRAPELAKHKEQQAALFGRSHTLLVRQDWSRLAEQLTELARIEDEFQEAVASQAEQL